MEHLSNQPPNDLSHTSWANKIRPPSPKLTGMETSTFYDLERQQGSWPSLINFCLSDGSELALPSNALEAVRLISIEEIRLFFGQAAITIKGQNLKPLHTQLLRKKVKEIREYPRDPMQEIQEGELQVEALIFETKFMERSH